MTFTPTTDIVKPEATATPTSTKAKRIAQMAGAAALSFGLAGTFAMPAYAVSDAEGAPDAVASVQQSLQTADVDSEVLPIEAPEGEVGEDILAQEAAEKAAEEAAEAEAAAEADDASGSDTAEPADSSYSGKDLPAGEGAEGLVAAAKAQVGVGQDCTDMVQNALAAIGLTERRDAGGYDHGVSDFYQYGERVTSGDYAPGDILIWPGAPHVAIYIGNGQAVHGGWGGGQTVINTYASPSATPDVVRLK